MSTNTNGNVWMSGHITSSLPEDSKIKCAAWPMSCQVPGSDQLSLR